MNYDTGQWKIIDTRANNPFADETITHVVNQSAWDHVNRADGEVRTRVDVFRPGDVFSTSWQLKADFYEVVLDE